MEMKRWCGSYSCKELMLIFKTKYVGACGCSVVFNCCVSLLLRSQGTFPVVSHIFYLCHVRHCVSSRVPSIPDIAGEMSCCL